MSATHVFQNAKVFAKAPPEFVKIRNYVHLNRYRLCFALTQQFFLNFLKVPAQFDL